MIPFFRSGFVCLVLILSCRLIGAQQPARDRWQLGAPLAVVVDDTAIEAIFHCVEFTEEQKTVVRGLHDAYWEGVMERAAALREAMTTGASGPVPTEPEAFAAYEAEHRKNVEKMLAAARMQRDASEALLNDFAALITADPEQRASLARDFRFEVLRLQFLHYDDPHAVFADFSGPVDLIHIVREAAEEDGELAPLYPKDDAPPLAPELADARATVDEIIARYRAQLMPTLEARLEDRLTPRDPRRPVVLRAGTPEYEAYMKEQIRIWNERSGMLDDYRNELRGVVLGSLGGEAAEALDTRIMRAWCPNLYHPNWPDIAIEQLRKDDSLDAEAIARLNIVYDQFVRERSALRRDAVQLGLRACRKFARVYGVEEEQRAYTDKLMTLRPLIMETHDRLRALLPTDRRVAFDAALDDAMRQDRRMLEPFR